MNLEFPEHLGAIQRVFRGHLAGMCANSVAHDLNNLLGAILSYSELIVSGDHLPEESRRMLAQITLAAQRCGCLVQTLADVARKEQPGSSMINPGPFVENTIALCRHDFRRARMELEYEDASAGCSMAVNAQQFQLALLCLLINACEAGAGKKNAKVRVRTVAQAGACSVAVQNMDIEIPDEIRERMFEPFFTTKGADHLGLGLSIARDFARRRQGDLTFDENAGFVLELKT
ncbi:MAG TPA: HAMP domain-containing sensor histidine kinase [Candidatus Hydrogenedentes bacterium]|nr:HAMP domain-containing sensor histidine kinase [Candidatus Hydrogenedentota bacterium]HRT19568.1 HAMP domain-containing sensor histidine kinase [Candidatus Hydrogenedentota bacterium]HRT64176.1 HAMP domain-containing sensor histidine kinase [Candidatus Hydrogenedentota bacterium]